MKIGKSIWEAEESMQWDMLLRLALWNKHVTGHWNGGWRPRFRPTHLMRALLVGFP